MDYISERIKTYAEEFDMCVPTGKLKKDEVETKHPLGEHAAARGLEGAYGDDEPEYTLDMLIAVNPKYEGFAKEYCPDARLTARGLEGAYGEGEPEYTLDMLISVS